MKTFLLLLLATFAAKAQNSINDYNIAVIPARMEFQKQPDQHKVNTHFRMFMEKFGFSAYLDTDIIPAEIAALPCNKVYGSVIDNSNLFMTKVRVVLSDCSNRVLFTSDEGTSREKDYERAYLQALRGAFASFERTYKYSGKKLEAGTPSVPLASSLKTEVANAPKVSSEPVIASERMAIVAKATASGYELTDAAGKHVMTLLRTSKPEMFIAQAGSIPGVFVKVGSEWRWEFYEKGNFMSVKMPVTLQ